MTRYTVVWEPEFHADFIRVWIAADSTLRAALTCASDWIDRHLVVDPDRQGRPSEFDPACRTILVPDTGEHSIVVLYRVRPDDRQVDVVAFQHDLDE
jgi:hypothetical protein